MDCCNQAWEVVTDDKGPVFRALLTKHSEFILARGFGVDVHTGKLNFNSGCSMNEEWTTPTFPPSDDRDDKMDGVVDNDKSAPDIERWLSHDDGENKGAIRDAVAVAGAIEGEYGRRRIELSSTMREHWPLLRVRFIIVFRPRFVVD